MNEGGIRDGCDVTATHGGWKVTVEGFATNREAEAVAEYMVTRFAELGAGKVVSVLREERGGAGQGNAGPLSE